jgi:hypothetical protein
MDPRIAERLCSELLVAIRGADASETPMDTTSAYFARRFCSACCREWGDMDVLIDLAARRTKVARPEVYLALRAPGPMSLLDHRACCNRALFPGQNNISNSTAHAIGAIQSSLGPAGPCSISLTCARARPPRRTPASGQTQIPMPLRGRVSIESVEGLLADLS